MAITSQSIELHVTDMHCQACVTRIKNVLERLQGVRKAEVNLEKGTAQVDYDSSEVGTDAMKEVIEKAGYTVKE